MLKIKSVYLGKDSEIMQVMKSMKDLSIEDKKIVGHSASVPKFTLGSDWKLHDGYYYYLNPVKPDALTGEMLATPMELIIETDRDGKNFYQVVEVFAEAVQAFPDDAVKEAWHVNSVSSSNQLQF